MRMPIVSASHDATNKANISGFEYNLNSKKLETRFIKDPMLEKVACYKWGTW